MNTDLHVYDDNGYEIQVDKAEGNYKRYRLKHGQKVDIVFSNTSVDDIDVVINDCWRDSKRCYVTMYDSYSEHLDALQFKNPEAAKNNKITSRYLVHDAVLGYNQFEYTTEFFERYFDMTGNKNITLDLAVRDLDDGYTQYTEEDASSGRYKKETIRYDLTNLAEKYCACEDKNNFSLDQYISTDVAADYVKNKLIAVTANKYINIINHVDEAITSLNENRVEKIEKPEIYISTPYFVVSYLMEDNYVNRQENLSEFYVYITKCIYERVVASVSENSITGLSFGREDPDGKYRYKILEVEGKNYNNDTTTTTVSYNTMKKIGKFANDNGLKFAWCPYSTPSEERKWQWDYIADIVNEEKREDEKTPLLDVIIMQPGLFYSSENKLDSASADMIKKIDLLYNSAKGQTFLKADDPINNDIQLVIPDGKRTSIGFQMEFDISLVTGRYLGETEDFIQGYPKFTAGHFIDTYEKFKDLIYNDVTPIGFYPGGPNEIALNDDINEENENVHTRLNHPSILGKPLFDDGAGTTIYTDEGETEAYSSFAEKIEEQKDDKCLVNERFANSAFKEYNNRLIYDIENALLNKNWTIDLKKYLGIIQGE